MEPFLHAPLAWSGLALASVPIIIHLINRRRLRRLDWAAMEFLLQALRKNRRRIRLEQLILLLLRVALMVLIALFLARPLISEGSFSWLASALKSEEKVFVVDDSLSMGQRHGDRTLLRRATGAVGDSLLRLADRGGRDRVTIVRTSRPDAPLVQADFIDRDRAAAQARSVESLPATSTRADLERTIQSLAERSAASASSTPRRGRAVSILTDLRASDWTDGAGEADATLAAAFERLTGDENRETRIVILDVGTEDTENVAVTGVEIEGGRPAVGIPSDLRIAVTNFGTRPVEDVAVQLAYAPVSESVESSSMARAPSIASIGPGETAVTGLFATFRTPGQYWATVEVSGTADALAEDNSLSFVVDVIEATEVLLVSGEPSSERFEGETDFLAVALRPEGEASTGIVPVVVVEENLPRDDLDRFGAVFLANVYSLPEDFRERLARFVEEGGTLGIFLGDQVDPVVYRRDFGLALVPSAPAPEAEPRTGAPDAAAGAPGGASDTSRPAPAVPAERPPTPSPETEERPGEPLLGLLPARIGEVQNRDESPVSISFSYDHPYFRFLEGEGERYVEQVSFRRYFELDPVGSARVIARFDDGEGSPAMVEAGAGAGHVLLVATTADAEWHDWPRNPTYLLVFQVILETAGRGRGLRPAHLAGTRIEIPIDVGLYDVREPVVYRGPDYPETPERQLIPSRPRERAADDSSLVVALDDTTRAGLSFLKLPRREGGSEERALAVRSDPRESDLSRIGGAALAELYPDIDFTVVRNTSTFSETGRGHLEISDVLIALFVAFLLVEGFLAMWFARHRRTGASATPESFPSPRLERAR